jgi:hypothetical protein
MENGRRTCAHLFFSFFAASSFVLFPAAAICAGGNGASRVDSALSVSKAQIAVNFKSIEELTKRCMQAKGWRYVPEKYIAGSANSFVPDYGEEDDFLLAFGYGIFSSPPPSPNRSPSPNEIFLSTLSPDEQNRYGVDLDGTDSKDGCRMRAFRQVYKGSLFSDSRFSAKLGSLEDGIQRDAEFRLAQQKWRTCMLQAGLNFRAREDVVTYFEEKLQQLNGSKKVVQPNGEVAIQVGNTVPDAKALAALAKDERFAAKTDVKCDRLHLRVVRERVRRTVLIKMAEAK